MIFWVVWKWRNRGDRKGAGQFICAMANRETHSGSASDLNTKKVGGHTQQDLVVDEDEGTVSTEDCMIVLLTDGKQGAKQ